MLGVHNLDQAAFKVLWRYALGLGKRRLSKALDSPGKPGEGLTLNCLHKQYYKIS
jgi:hypothetical protein